MAHLRVRFISSKLKETLKKSPSISLLGMRQTGKTTLLKQICQSYFTLDDDRTLNQFSSGQWALLEEAKPPIAIDECQKLPNLFDRIKLLIDQRKQLGRFILTGSVRFLSKKQIKESLTGRTLVIELLPMTLNESSQLEQRDILATLESSSKFANFVSKWKPGVWANFQNIDHHLKVGGLPGICFKRDVALRNDLLEQHIDTLLSRDLQMLYQTKLSLPKLKMFLKECALMQGQDWSIEKTAKKIGTSAPTLKSVLLAFEGLFLIRMIGKKLYFEDSGIAHFLIPNELISPLHIYRSFVFRELFALLRYQYSRAIEIDEYTTRGGIDIPFIIQTENHRFAFTVDTETYVSEKSLKSLGKYNKKFNHTKCIAFHRGPEAYESSTGIWCLPLTWLV